MEPLLEHRKRWASCDLNHRDSNLANKDQIWSAPPAQHSEGSSGLFETVPPLTSQSADHRVNHSDLVLPDGLLPPNYQEHFEIYDPAFAIFCQDVLIAPNLTQPLSHNCLEQTPGLAFLGCPSRV